MVYLVGFGLFLVKVRILKKNRFETLNFTKNGFDRYGFFSQFHDFSFSPFLHTIFGFSRLKNIGTCVFNLKRTRDCARV